MTSAARRRATLEAVADRCFALVPFLIPKLEDLHESKISWTISEESINVWNDLFLVLSQRTLNKNLFLSVFIYQCLVDMPLHHLWSFK